MTQRKHESGGHHPIRSAEQEVEHLREIADDGESTATPAIIVAGWFAFLVPLAALLMLLVFGVAHFAR